MKVVRALTIENTAGLHMRAASALVHITEKFQSDIMITKDGETVNGKSIMGVMMLAALMGSVIHVSVNGDDADEAMTAIADLIHRKFDEP